VQDLPPKLSRLLDADPRVEAAWLFGSVARGDDGPTSDLDVGVLLGEAPRTLLGQPWSLAEELTAAAGREVDLVVLNDAPVDLVVRVFRDGQLLVGRDSSARVAFEVRTRNAYWDLLPYLEEYRRGA